MASRELAVSLNYLADAAHLLRLAASETSAHLMRQRADLLRHNGLVPNEDELQLVCGACGHIMILGQKSSMQMQPRMMRKGKRKAASGQSRGAPKTQTGPTKVITCGLCNAITRISMPVPVKVTHRRIARKSTRPPKETVTTLVQDKKPTANASSKKRAKGRKGGLQALLAGQKQTSGPSLSLADFRQ